MTQKNFGDIADCMKDLAAGVAEAANRVKRQKAMMMHQALITATPVDTGQARANWRIGLNKTPTGIVPAPSSPTTGAQEAIDQGRGEIARAKPEDTIVIANNTPHLAALNNGTSKQAPANFIEKAIQSAVKGTTKHGPTR